MNVDLKALIKIVFDITIIFICCFVASTVTGGQITILSKSFTLFFILICVTLIPIGSYFKIYYDISLYFNSKNVFYIFLATLLSFITQTFLLLILKYFDLNFTKTILIFYNYKNISLIHIFFFLIAVNLRLLVRTYLNIK